MANRKRSKAPEPEIIEDLVEDAAEPETETVEMPLTYLVKDGENILTVADKFKPSGISRSDYAQTLANLNGTVAPGRLVRLG